MSTIIDVAKAANVSSATVSRVLNGAELVSPETRERVMKAVKELKYEPNLASRNLRRRESRVILVTLPDIGSFYGEILAGIGEKAWQEGYHPLITTTGGNPFQERELLRILDRKQADGLITMASMLPAQELVALKRRFPIVQCCEYTEGTGLSHVSINNYTANYQATSHLIRVGHQHIAMISSTNHFLSTRHREAAYRQALMDNNIPFRQELLRRGSYSFESGYEQTQILLRNSPAPTAILCICDNVAAGCISALAHASRRVPADVAVMGFDNIDMAKMLQPPLSTIMQPLKRLGNTAVELLLDLLSGQEDVVEIFLPHELIIRESTM